jgi:3-methyladenine DNA glycosylase/8-oxoguanine DNA glycosylase
VTPPGTVWSGASAWCRVADIGPYAAREAFAALVAHAVPGLERVDVVSGTYERLVPSPVGPTLVRAVFADDRVSVDAQGPQVQDAQAQAPRARATQAPQADGGSPDGHLATVERQVRQWLDLDTDLEAVAGHLEPDPVVGPLVAANPTLRILGAFDGFEATVMTVLGQHVSLAAARTFGARLVARWGVPHEEPGLSEFPAAATLSALDAAELQSVVGVTGQRARTLVALARECAGGLVVAPDADHAEVCRRLLDLPGVGPWTVDYVAMRALRDPDAFPHGDLVLRRALDVPTPRDVLTRSLDWKPWRAYAAIHLWHHAAYAKHL